MSRIFKEKIKNRKLAEAMTILNEKYGENYNVLSKKMEMKFIFPFLFKKQYTFELELNDEEETKKKMIASLKDSKKRRKIEKEKTNSNIIPFSARDEIRKNEANNYIPEEQLAVMSYLEGQGIKKETVKKIVNKVSCYVRQENQSLKDLVSCEIESLLNLYEGEIEDRVSVLFGPTGIGKTTTVIKMVNKNKNKRSHVITNDNKRFGAYEEMEAYSKKYNFTVTKSDIRAEDSLPELKDNKIEKIIIDTAGTNPKNKQINTKLEEYYKKIKPDHKFLTISATQKYSDMIKTVKTYEEMEVDSLIITKLDETDEVGFIIDLAIETDIPVSYITNGQQPTAFINRLTANDFISYLWKDFN